MESPQPLVSLIIPTFNRRHLLGETLNSVLQQKYENWECLIIDDGSFDKTDELVQGYEKKDSRIKFFSRPGGRPKGANACRNYGFELCQGEFVKWLDSDDLLHGDSLGVQVRHLQDNLQIDASVGYADYFVEDIEDVTSVKPKKYSSQDIVYDYVLGEIFFITAGPLWRKTFLDERELLFDENMSRLQDTEFHYRMLLGGMKFQFLDRSVFYYRHKNPDSITENSGDQNLYSIFMYWRLVMRTARCKNSENQKKLTNYLVNNLSLLYHRMIINQNTLSGRSKIAFKYLKEILGVYQEVKVDRRFYPKFIAGIATTILSGKGLRLFRTTNVIQ